MDGAQISKHIPSYIYIYTHNTQHGIYQFVIGTNYKLVRMGLHGDHIDFGNTLYVPCIQGVLVPKAPIEVYEDLTDHMQVDQADTIFHSEPHNRRMPQSYI